MEWWFATMGTACLAAAAVATCNSVLAFVTMMLFVPLAVNTLYTDFDRFWILMVLVFAVEMTALARHIRAIRTRGDGRPARNAASGRAGEASVA